MAFSKDDSPPDSSIHGISQARILEWLPFLSPGHLPDPGIETESLASLAFDRQMLYRLNHQGSPRWYQPLLKKSRQKKKKKEK